MLRHFPTRPPLIDLPLDEFCPVDPLRHEAIVTGAQSREETLVVAAEQREGPRVLNLQSRLRAASRAIVRLELAPMASARVDALP